MSELPEGYADCPECEGTGSEWVHVQGHGADEYKCWKCKGEGMMSKKPVTADEILAAEYAKKKQQWGAYETLHRRMTRVVEHAQSALSRGEVPPEKRQEWMQLLTWADRAMFDAKYAARALDTEMDALNEQRLALEGAEMACHAETIPAPPCGEDEGEVTRAAE